MLKTTKRQRPWGKHLGVKTPWAGPDAVVFNYLLKLLTLMSYLRKSFSFGKRSHLVNGWKSFSGPFQPSDRIAPDWVSAFDLRVTSVEK
jgi:hypothetical protein